MNETVVTPSTRDTEAAHGAHRAAEHGQFAAAAVEVLYARRVGVLAVPGRHHLVRRAGERRPHVPADRLRVHVVRPRLRDRLLAHERPREAVQEGGEPRAARVRHLEDHDAGRVGCDDVGRLALCGVLYLALLGPLFGAAFCQCGCDDELEEEFMPHGMSKCMS